MMCKGDQKFIVYCFGMHSFACDLIFPANFLQVKLFFKIIYSGFLWRQRGNYSLQFLWTISENKFTQPSKQVLKKIP